MSATILLLVFLAGLVAGRLWGYRDARVDANVAAEDAARGSLSEPCDVTDITMTVDNIPPDIGVGPFVDGERETGLTMTGSPTPRG